MNKVFTCRCGCITFTVAERRSHLQSKLHAIFQKKLEYLNNN